METKKHERVGIGLLTFSIIISTIFTVLKLLNLWNISWFWVCFPMLLTGCVFLFLILVFIIIMIVILLRLLFT